MISQAAVIVIALGVVLVGFAQSILAHRRVDALLEAQAQERQAWARERWELNTRIQSPELARMAPPPAPAAPQAADDDEDGDDEIDESHMVGMVLSEPVDGES